MRTVVIARGGRMASNVRLAVASLLRLNPGAVPMQRCRRQTSPIAGTIFASTHLPLRLGSALCVT